MMIINAKERLYTFKFSDKEVKEDIKENLRNILRGSRYFGWRNGRDYYIQSVDGFEGTFLPPDYAYQNKDTKKTQHFDIPVKLTKTKTFSEIQILDIATVEFIVFVVITLFLLFI